MKKREGKVAVAAASKNSPRQSKLTVRIGGLHSALLWERWVPPPGPFSKTGHGFIPVSRRVAAFAATGAGELAQMHDMQAYRSVNIAEFRQVIAD